MSIEDHPPADGSAIDEWKKYARRLEQKIGNQRKVIHDLTSKSEQAGNGNKWNKARVAMLERALGQSEARAFKRREAREGMFKRLLEARAEIEELRKLLEENHD